MGALEHVASWRLILATLPAVKSSALVLLLATLLLLIFSASVVTFSKKKEVAVSDHLDIRRVEENSHDLLIKLFSQGILHPRLYILAR